MRNLILAILVLAFCTSCEKEDSNFPATTDHMFIPSTFNPWSGSGNNAWRPVYNPGLENPDKRCLVFDRDGIIMFDATDFLTGWNGQYHGEKMPTGTYSYRVTLDYGNSHIREFDGPLYLIQ